MSLTAICISSLILNRTRRLPPLSSSLVTPAPVDNPALHQGRIRTTPHIEGQYAAHVYVSLAMERASALSRVIHDVLVDAKAIVPSLNSWSAGELSTTPELHVSLSRPTYLRAHQREILKKAVKDLSRRFVPCVIYGYASLDNNLNCYAQVYSIFCDIFRAHQ